MGQEAARRGRHLGLAARRHRSCRRHPGRRWRRRPAAAAEAALLLAPGRVRRRRLRPAAGPARLLPARPDPGHRAPARGQRRLRPLPRQWVAERTLSWLGRWRRLAREYEELPEVSETMVKLAMIRLMLHRLAHPNRKRLPAP